MVSFFARRAFTAGLVLLCLLVPQGSDASSKIALVIGNNSYQHASYLTNPANDAGLIADALRILDFDVSEVHNLDQVGFLRTLQHFKSVSRGAEISVIYFAGHGIELNRANFLIPVDAELRADTDVPFEAIALDLLLESVAPASRLRLVILDACRNNPFEARMVRSAGTRSVGRGLAAVEPVGNTLVAFAAKEGTVAFDGAAGNSPYALALQRSLLTPGIEIAQLFRRVRDEVLTETRGEQEPFVYGSLSAEQIFLNAAPPVTEGRSETSGIDPVELAIWEFVSRSERMEDFEDFLARYPEGVFANFAQRRLDIMRNIGLPPQQPSVDDAEALGSATEFGEAAAHPLPVLSRDEIREIQEILTVLDLGPGPIDGVLGPRTRGALRMFQEEIGNPATGELSSAQFARLRTSVSTDELERLRVSLRDEERQRAAARAALQRGAGGAARLQEVQPPPTTVRPETSNGVGEAGNGSAGGGWGG